MKDFDQRRVKAALNGQLDAQCLSRSERSAFDDSLGSALAIPSAKSVKEMTAVRKAGGAVGYDKHGRLVRTLTGGGIEILEE